MKILQNSFSHLFCKVFCKQTIDNSMINLAFQGMYNVNLISAITLSQKFLSMWSVQRPLLNK